MSQCFWHFLEIPCAFLSQARCRLPEEMDKMRLKLILQRQRLLRP